MIQVTTEKVKQQVTEYPKLMTTETGRIVLFTKESLGVILCDPDGYYDIGRESGGWLMSCFKPLTTPLTIQNV